jgi:hypothetical protein
MRIHPAIDHPVLHLFRRQVSLSAQLILQRTIFR